MKFFISTFLCVLISISTFGLTKPLLLEDSSAKFIWHKGNYSIYFDSIHNSSLLRIKEIYKKDYFIPTPYDAPRLQSFDQDMWANFRVVNQSPTQQNWLIELYDFHIDSYDIYIIDDKGLLCNHFAGGDNIKNFKKEIDHKNFVYEVLFKQNVEYTIYVRIQSKQSVAVNGVIRTYKSFVSYSNKEYTLLSIFYGVLAIMFLYCITIFIATIEKTYLYFSINILSVGLYCLSNDGLGFQFIWKEALVFNEYAQSLSITLFSASSLMYSAAFLQVSRVSKKYYLLIRLLIVIRFVMFVFAYCFYKPMLYMYQFDIAILIFIWFTTIYFYKKEYVPARFFILAYTALFVGFTIHILMVLGFINNTIVTVYGLNFGILFQLFFFSFALADRVRIVNSETRNAQLNLIAQLKENDALKDKLTKELEEKVEERTKEIEYKNQQLEAFVYKASHDIKGPLKSIIGLAKLGLLDVEDKNAREYFSHIEKSSERLDNLVADLLQVSKIKSLHIKETQINFEEIIEEIKYSLNNLPNFNTFQVELTINQEKEFYSDRNIIYSIFQNLIENAFTYRDIYKEKSTLNIRIEISQQNSIFEFEDNGVGINQDNQDKVFDMFFRASDISGGSGLGLYLVKMAVNKIGGNINIESKVKKGTVFTIVI